MARLYHARVCAVGSREDMLRLTRAMLDNTAALREETENALSADLEGQLEAIRLRASWEGGQDCGFLMEMIAPNPFGGLIPESSHLRVAQQPCGLWTAVFIYDSTDPFQARDWQKLHKRCDRLLMLALHAGEYFSHDKGGVIITGGEIHEDWSTMAECWMWLHKQYYAGRPAEGLGQSLTRLDEMLAEEWDQDAKTLLTSCREHLDMLCEAERHVTAESLAAARQAQDYRSLFAMQQAVALGQLWETEHIALWRACLNNALSACGE